MSTTEKHPRELRCAAAPCEEPSLLSPRDVPLGGPRAMTVHRTLPQRARSLIGPWCFVDHFGPDDVAATGGMAVPRHPHTGLATVTLLFEGQIDHVDSTGFANTVRPGEVNLMIAGRGVSHSEFSTASTTVLHGVQLWYALPDGERFGRPVSQHHIAPLNDLGCAAVRTYLGRLPGAASPIETRTPALAAEILLPADGRLELALDAASEHGLLVDTGAARMSAHGPEDPGGVHGTGADGAPAPGAAHRAPLDIPVGHLAHIPAGADALILEGGPEPTRLILIGGPPFAEEIVMWWNFVGRTHEEIADFRARWQREIGREGGAAGSAPASHREDRAGAPPTPPAPSAPPQPLPAGGLFGPLPAGDLFGPFPADTPAALPAPTLPNARITPRRRPRPPTGPAGGPHAGPPVGPSPGPTAHPHEGDPR